MDQPPQSAVLIGWRSRDRNGGAKGALRAVGGGWLGAHQKGRHPHFLSVGWTLYSTPHTHTSTCALRAPRSGRLSSAFSSSCDRLDLSGHSRCTHHYKVVILMRITAEAKNRRARLHIDTKLNAPAIDEEGNEQRSQPGLYIGTELELPPQMTKGVTNMAPHRAFTCCRLPITTPTHEVGRNERDGTREYQEVDVSCPWADALDRESSQKRDDLVPGVDGMGEGGGRGWVGCLSEASYPMTTPGDGGVACGYGDHTGCQLHAAPPSLGTIVRCDVRYGHLTLALTLTLTL